MGFEPQKFFIGVIDFFSILLPGAVLALGLYLSAGPQIFRVLAICPADISPAQGWVAFLFSSYLLGHFLFFIGSWLDDLAYDPLRNMTRKEQITHPLPKIMRWLLWLCFKKDANAAVDRVVTIKEGYLNRIGASHAVNAFQWCKARLATEHPEALATVNRFEADSKFFRSFVPVMLFVLARALYCRHWWLATGSIVAMGLAFLRYVEQRFKSTQQAYWYILTLEASKEALSPGVKPSSS